MEIPNLSVIIKILGFNTTDEHYSLLTNFINDSNVYDLNDEIVDKTIELRKKNKIKLPDAIVASTALVNKCALINRNISDFKNIDGLNVINLYDF